MTRPAGRPQVNNSPRIPKPLLPPRGGSGPEPLVTFVPCHVGELAVAMTAEPCRPRGLHHAHVQLASAAAPGRRTVIAGAELSDGGVVCRGSRLLGSCLWREWMSNVCG